MTDNDQPTPTPLITVLHRFSDRSVTVEALEALPEVGEERTFSDGRVNTVTEVKAMPNGSWAVSWKRGRAKGLTGVGAVRATGRRR